jgi:deazaflavin-dependent oxidoreductase (nitroreductase family)
MPVDERELSWNAHMIADFREHGGQITEGRLAGANMVLLTTTGAKSGETRTVPLGYSRDGDGYIVVGSNSGKVEHPQWLANIEANPTVTVEVGTESFIGRATITTGAERERLWKIHTTAIPFFLEYEKQVERELQVVKLEH